MNDSTFSQGISRRRFLATTSAAIIAPTLIPASALGADGRPAPSERIVMGTIGWGMQGPGNTGGLLGQKDCQVVAACDLDTRHLEAAVNTVNNHYKTKDCQAYHDYRELMARKDIDAVTIAIPDNWHALVATEALRNKKDVWGEKPLARTIAEQQAIVKAVQENKCIWQTGSWQRSVGNFHKAAEIVRSGLIGKVTRVEVGLPSGHSDFARTREKKSVTPPPKELDYEMWIGPAQMEPYIEGRVHMNWRWNYNIGGGQLLDWIGHHCDIAHWGMGWDNSGPVTVEGQGEFPPRDAVWNTCTKYRINLTYADGTPMVIAGGHGDIRSGTKWIGTDGWVWVDRGGFQASNEVWREWRSVPEAFRKVKLIKSGDHTRNFLDSIKSRQPTVTPVETAHHSAIPGHLGLIAMLVGRKLTWDPVKEVIQGDEAASKLLSRGYREPWKLA